jgi:ABC-2 type transport system permease protein
MGAVYLLTLRQLSGRVRLAIMLVLATLPVLTALTVVWSERGPSVEEFETSVLSAMLAGSIIPLVVLAIGTAAFANEIEDRTLANLTLAPIPRWQIAVPKLLATTTVAAPFIGASALLTGWIAFTGDVTATVAVTGSALVGVVLYAAVFVWLGLVTTQVIGVGLLYIVLWEGFFSGFVSGVRVLSIRHYSIAFMHGLDERRFASADLLEFSPTVAVSLVVVTGFVWLTVRRLRRMDVP